MGTGRRLHIAGLALIAVLACGGCSRSTSQSSTRDGATARLGQHLNHVAGLEWTTPARWSVGAARPMRVATYQIPPAAGDSEPAECAVYFFGTGQGGGVEANLDRWATQFAQPDGRPAVPQEKDRTINGITLHTIHVEGTYLAAGGPMTTVTQTKPGYAMLGAIVEAPQGLVFFKFTGPAKTVSDGQAEFDAMLGSLRRQ
ncbi:MAG: hypothetical protein LAP13_12380 [Acidobacteriia bacterium]|nr:hypothetical protein [Terriglobia bacterium]